MRLGGGEHPKHRKIIEGYKFEWKHHDVLST